MGNSSPLGVAIHGAGSVARAHAASWQRCPHARIVSISSHTFESARQLADELGLRSSVHNEWTDVLEDPSVDIVDLTGPNFVHAQQAIDAAAAGKHLLIEKPIAMTIEENRALRDAVANSDVRSLASFVLRWNPLFDNIKSLLAHEALGQLVYAEVDYWHNIGPSYTGWEWARRRETGGSTMLLAGCHAVDALRWFVRDEVSEVSAFSNNTLLRYEYDANVVAVVKFRNGVIGKVSTLFDVEIPYTFNIDLIGTEGAIRDERLWAPRWFPRQTDWASVPTIMPDSGDVDHHPFDAEVAHFVDCIRSDYESHCNVADAYHTHEVCLAIDRSIELGGEKVSLPLE